MGGLPPCYHFSDLNQRWHEESPLRLPKSSGLQTMGHCSREKVSQVQTVLAIAWGSLISLLSISQMSC